MQYEVEIKALFKEKSETDEILNRIQTIDSSFKIVDTQSQLNHYFKNGSLMDLISRLDNLLNNSHKNQLKHMHKNSKEQTVRTRKKNQTVLLIVKASIDGNPAVHSQSRIELEIEVNKSLDDLDKLVLASGYELEAKWQAERKLYSALGLTIDVMFSPGYGYVIEFEKVVNDQTEVASAKQDITQVIEKLGVSELDPKRLARMYAYYNEHWRDYYGTDKVFDIL